MGTIRESKDLESILKNRLSWLLKTASDSVWEIGFSGGKDSSALVNIVLKFLLKLKEQRKDKMPKRVYIIYCDTLLEYPQIREETLKVLDEMRQFIKENRLQQIVKIRRVTPSPKEDFFTCVIEKGYVMPHRMFRWCTDRLKAKPTIKVLSNIAKTEKCRRIILISGARLEESTHRKVNLKKIGLTGDEILRLATSKFSSGSLKIETFVPFLDVTEKEIWTYLSNNNTTWNNHRTFDYLIELYGVNKTNEKVRFGCWTCTLIAKDKAGKWLSRRYGWVKDLLNCRKFLWEISHDEKLKKKLRYRNKKRFGGFGGLNSSGKLCAILPLIFLLAQEDSWQGLSGYLQEDAFLRKLKTWIHLVKRNQYKFTTRSLRDMWYYFCEIMLCEESLKKILEMAEKKITKSEWKSHKLLF